MGTMSIVLATAPRALSPTIHDPAYANTKLQLVSSPREIALASGLGFGGLIIGLLVGHVGWALLVALVMWAGIQWLQFKRVAAWSERPWRKPQNGFDSWFQLAYAPHRALRRERIRTRAATTRLREILNLVELIPDGVIVLAPSGEITGINTAANRLLQLSDADIGLTLPSVVRTPQFVEFLGEDGFTGEAPILEFPSPFDPEHTLEARRIDTEEGGMIIIIRDITTLNRLLTVRQDFVANVSHELRTPLAVIAGYMETLLDTEQPDELRLEVAGRMEKPVKRMQSLIDDLMHLTRLESTHYVASVTPVDLAAIALSASQELQGSQGRIAYVGNEQCLIDGTHDELHSVCTNLLSNALRYSPPDSPVAISVTAHDDVIRLSVEDQGFGIPPEHLHRLTERFYRVDMTGSSARGGTGLGLAIVKHVLRRHNTSIDVQSELGVGSTFSCEFPRSNSERGQTINDNLRQQP